MLFFNTAGPVNRQDHYCLSPLKRFDLEEMEMLFAQKKYFVLHAPRQTGKTTCMLALADYLNKKGDYKCLYCNVEAAQAARENILAGIRSVLSSLGSRALQKLKDDFIENHWKKILENNGELNALELTIGAYAENSDKPVILIIDEIDALVGDTLISVLRQLRSGYEKRPDHFPSSIILCGVRDIQDYRIHSGRDKAIITGGSAFNIKAESLRLGDFNKKETFDLLKQHEKETGQIIEQNALESVWKYSQGQPWLVNALGYEICFKMKENRNRKKSITEEMVHQAKENLILRRETHLDQLGDKLKEERVRKVVEPILTGSRELSDLMEDDLQYITDLGLIRRKPVLEVANPIYREIIPRMLTSTTQDRIIQKSAWYIKPDNTLDMHKLIKAFQDFFREHSEHWLQRFQYKEAGPQLLLQAFLQRIINSGGRVEREYGLGRRRVDLLVLWSGKSDDSAYGAKNEEAKKCKNSHNRGQLQQTQKTVIELKILYKSLEQTIAEGIEQTADYMDISNSNEGHLIIFNRSENISWDEKIFVKKNFLNGKKIIVWGM